MYWFGHSENQFLKAQLLNGHLPQGLCQYLNSGDKQPIYWRAKTRSPVVLVVDEVGWDASNLQGVHNSAKPEETTQSWQLMRYTMTEAWSKKTRKLTWSLPVLPSFSADSRMLLSVLGRGFRCVLDLGRGTGFTFTSSSFTAVTMD